MINFTGKIQVLEHENTSREDVMMRHKNNNSNCISYLGSHITICTRNHLKIITSNQDTNFLSNVLEEHQIDHLTAEDEDHNILSIIDEFMRTRRDLNKHR